MSPSPHTYVAKHFPRFVRELQEFVRVPSVSAGRSHTAHVRAGAQWLAEHLQAVGLSAAKVLPTGGHPVVVASTPRLKGRPTVLIYGHYDVQPAEPLDRWTVPPFGGIVRDGYLYGRGESDDKGQFLLHIKAIESLLRTRGPLPFNLRLLIEGEEEIGSANLAEFIASHRDALRADVAVISDMKVVGPDAPAITYAVRGELGFDLTLRGQTHDLHSGVHGGAVHNPLQAICEILSRLHTADGRVAVPGFYDDVVAVPQSERRSMRQSGPDDRAILRDAGASRPWGEPGYTLYERTTIRPALTFNGVTGGHAGHGAKAVIPSSVNAKVSFRLVPRQDPAKIERLFRAHLARITPATVRLTVTRTLASNPAVVDRSHPAIRAAAGAYRRVFRNPPAFLRLGGSLPVVDMFQRLLGTPSLMMGFALPDDNIHGPDERFSLKMFAKGIQTSILFLSSFGGVRGKTRSHLGAARLEEVPT